MDPGKELERYGSADLVLVLDRTGALTLVRETATQETITAAVEAVLRQ